MMDPNQCVHMAPKLLVVITDWDNVGRVETIYREKHVFFHYVATAMGTASSEVLKAFGLSGTRKAVCMCIEPAARVKPLITAMIERFEFTRPGNGIAFIIPISGISATVSGVLDKQERLADLMDKEVEKPLEHQRHELVVAVINQGYSETLMSAARAAGARGGTIIHARQSGIEETVKFFGISLQAEKELVAILIQHGQKRELMQAISRACGMRTEAQGIVISLPVEACAGIDMP